MNNKIAQQSKKNPSLKNFDKSFLKSMIKHHQDGLKIMKIAQEKAEDKNVVSMAKKMEKDQSKEIEEMKKMLEKFRIKNY